MDAVAWYYGGRTPETLVDLYRADLRRAAALDAAYVVFHVTDVSVEENYTYRWLHTNEEIIDARQSSSISCWETPSGPLLFWWKTSGGRDLR